MGTIFLQVDTSPDVVMFAVVNSRLENIYICIYVLVKYMQCLFERRKENRKLSRNESICAVLMVTLSPSVPESRFDHDTEESGEDMDDDEEEEEVEEEEAGDGDPTPHSQTHSRSPTPEENYIPDSPPISPVELKKELPKYLPALQVRTNAPHKTYQCTT